MHALIRRITKGHPPESVRGRALVGRFSGAVGIFANVLLFLGKLLVGAVSGSVAITADAMNNLTDASSSIVTLIGFRLAEKPADADHPYGHARFEYLSGLAVSAMILIIGFELAKGSVEKLLSPAPVVFSAPLVLVLAGSILVKLWLAFINRRLGKLIGSTALEATAADSRNDVFATAAVLLAAVIEHFTRWQVDGWIGLAVALFILYSGCSLARQTVSPLLGEAADPKLRQQILELVRSHPKVLGLHDLMVHDYGPGQRFASLHVEMDHNEDPLLCHDIIDDIERDCMEQYQVHLVIHYDPVVTGDAELEHTKALVQELLTEYDHRLTLHDFRMVRGVHHTNLIFDVVIPDGLLPHKKEIQTQLDAALTHQAGGPYYTVITFDPEAFNE